MAATPSTAVLFDPALETLPSAQGWVFLTDPLFFLQPKVRVASVDAGAVLLDSTPVTSEKAGWFSHLPPLGRHPRQPALDAAEGFVLSFQARLRSETHSSPDRAGFSVIATASNLDGIELGFWPGEIWAQSGPDFRHAEGVALETTAARTRYDLVLQGPRYRLCADGATVLEGDLRRYDSFGQPYNIPEFLFLGDDTSSAGAATEIGRIVVSALPRITAIRGGTGLTLMVDAEEGRDVVFEQRVEPPDSGWTAVGIARSEGGIARLQIPFSKPQGTFRARLR